MRKCPTAAHHLFIGEPLERRLERANRVDEAAVAVILQHPANEDAMLHRFLSMTSRPQEREEGAFLVWG
jgi:hypothetical protein